MHLAELVQLMITWSFILKVKDVFFVIMRLEGRRQHWTEKLLSSRTAILMLELKIRFLLFDHQCIRS